MTSDVESTQSMSSPEGSLEQQPANAESALCNSSPLIAGSKKPKGKTAEENHAASKTCKVCGDHALNLNFGAVSCESCKAFFRRNALRKKEFRCPFQNSCRIDVESRRWCQQCRLQKCLEVGMKKQLIQKVKRNIKEEHQDDTQRASEDECKTGKSKDSASPQTKKNRKKKGCSRPKQSSMTVIKCAEISNDVSEVCSPSSAAAESSSSSIDAEVTLVSVHLSALGSFEKTKIFELVKANEVMMESNVMEEGAAVRYQERQSLVDVINMTDIAIRRLIKMAKRIDGFKNLLQEDQIALLKGSCFEMMILRAVTHYNPEKDCWQGPQSTMIKVDVLKEARGNFYEEIKSFIDSFAQELRQDEILLLILGAIVLFHPERPFLAFRGQIRAEQSLYYFLLRSYIRSRNPTSSLQEIDSIYTDMTTKVDLLHLLNDRHSGMFMEVNPKEVEPLLIEIFDLKPSTISKP